MRRRSKPAAGAPTARGRPVLALLAVLALLVGLALVASPAWAQEPGPPPPDLEIRAPESLAGWAAEVDGYDRRRLRVAMRLAGLREAGPPVRVLLVEEDAPEARRVPPWVAGYALSERDTVVLLPARGPSYPDRSLEALLHHEIAHVLIHRAAAGRPVPRWFHEGVAMAVARAWSLEDTTRFALARLSGRPVPLARLDGWFRGEPSRVRRAYVLAGAFVQQLLEEHGPEVTGDVLAGVGRGAPFPQAFHQATGTTLPAAEAAFRESFAGWTRWVPFLTSSIALWMLVTALALVAIWRRRRRDAELRERWAEEEDPGGLGEVRPFEPRRRHRQRDREGRDREDRDRQDLDRQNREEGSDEPHRGPWVH